MRKDYVKNIAFVFIISYSILSILENFLSNILSSIIGHLMHIYTYNNLLFFNNKIFIIDRACTCSLEMTIFLSFVFATPKVKITYKILYSIFGLLVINVVNILRIIMIITYKTDNFQLAHDVISFILFPVALFLNVFWIVILKKLNILRC
ncbi:hypothetical protein J422_01900 [Methanocaldococcus villosus KIN24-T80]|uniref:Exosortase EpsH-related protein n=1 Tax=Methanocaldococcus villosus KIN24-T80 TaxID=1069083 RepID=N6VZJ1_9EURY|nr:archaeosortase D [Methanocaldococcus villosus]ENN96527.1 hypothetical protein J422_01900 [Methanocaldococcus villosus KIN24-T80]